MMRANDFNFGLETRKDYKKFLPEYEKDWKAHTAKIKKINLQQMVYLMNTHGAGTNLIITKYLWRVRLMFKDILVKLEMHNL